MAKSVLDIVIKLTKEGGADKQTIDGLVGVKKSLLEAAAVGGTFIAAGVAIKKVLDETVGTLVAYAEEVRRVQNATGASAEDSSKLIQILDDQKISYEQLEKAIQKSGKAYDFSIAGIAGMSDAYLKLGSEQEKAAFMQERFGKQWISFVPIMQQGKQAILDSADAVDKSLVLTQKGVDQARQYEIALDDWNDSVEGLKISIGSELLPTLLALISATAQVKNAQDGLNEAEEKHAVIIANSYEAGQRLKAAHLENVEAAEKHGEALMGVVTTNQAYVVSERDVNAENRAMLGLITNIASETKNYSDKQQVLTKKMKENRAEAEKLYPWQKEKLDELNATYAEMEDTYASNAEAHNAAMGKIQYDLLVTKLSADGLTDAEFEMAQQAGIMFGVFDEASAKAASDMNAVAEAIQKGRLRVEDMQKALALLSSHTYSIDVALNVLTYGFATYGNGYSYATGDLQYQNGGYAEGGIASGSQSGHMELLHGTEGVFTKEQMAHLAPVGMSTGGGMTINLTYAPMFSTASAEEVEQHLMPFIQRGIRQSRRQ